MALLINQNFIIFSSNYIKDNKTNVLRGPRRKVSTDVDFVSILRVDIEVMYEVSVV